MRVNRVYSILVTSTEQETDFMPTDYCRICWNENGWRYPSGSTRRDSGYAGKNGFGHEEWLFNFSWTSDNGYHYAFLQPVSKVRKKRAGESLDLLLWAIAPNGKRLEAGRINNCGILTPEEARHALNEHKKKRWFQQMQKDVEAVGGKKEELDWEDLFNVRFRREDAIVFDPPEPFAKVPEKIMKCSHYLLMKADDADFPSLPADRNREGTTDLPGELDGTFKVPSIPVFVDPQEKRLQKRLMELLQERFGVRNVSREGGFGPAPFDLVVRKGQRTILIEMKAYADARRVIREALGQILEYVFFYPKTRNRAEDVDLFIVAPALMNEAASSYMDLLQTRFAIPVHYCSFTLGDPLPIVFADPDGSLGR
jgi:hypothetical protein